jgi:transcriptional regulator with XRE-family HTH domain
MAATRKASGAKIKRRREDLGISLPTLAERAGISRGGLSKIENDLVRPHATTLVKLAKALNVQLDDISSRDADRQDVSTEAVA